MRFRNCACVPTSGRSSASSSWRYVSARCRAIVLPFDYSGQATLARVSAKRLDKVGSGPTPWVAGVGTAPEMRLSRVLSPLSRRALDDPSQNVRAGRLIAYEAPSVTLADDEAAHTHSYRLLGFTTGQTQRQSRLRV